MKPKNLSLFASSRIQTSLATFFLAAGLPVISQAADQTWKGTTDALWTTTSNWSGAAVPGSGDLAIFDTLSTANLATTLGAGTSVLGLKVVAPTAAVSIATGNTLTIGASGIDMSAAAQNLTIASPLLLNTFQTWNVGTGRTLTLSATAVSTGSTGTVTKSGVGALQLNAPLLASGGTVLAGGITTTAAGNFVNSFGGTVTFANGAILTNGNGASNTMTLQSSLVVDSGQTGTWNMGAKSGWGNNTTTYTLTGAGTMNLIAATTTSRNDISADMTAFSGNINFGGSGTVRLFINGGKVGAGFSSSTLDLAGSVVLNPQTNSGGNTINVNALTGTSATAALGGGSAGSPIYSVGLSGIDTTYGGGITGNAALTKVGSGTLTLTSTTALTYTGATTVTEGTLKVNGTKSGTGATTVNGTGSSGRLSGTGSIAGTTTVSANGYLAPGDGAVASGIGNINTSNLTLAAGSLVNLEFGSGNDTVTVPSGGTLTLNPGIKINAYSGTEAGGTSFGTNGTYPIFNVTGATVAGFNSSSFVVNNPVAGKFYSFMQSATTISMVVSNADPSNYWNVDGSGTWNLAGNWTKNAIPNAIGALAKIGPGQGGLGGGFNSNATITLDGDKTVGELTLNDNFAALITIDPGTVIPGTLLMDNGANAAGIVCVAGSHIINAPVSVDPQGVAVDVADTYSLTTTGVISGASAALTKAGLGKLILSGNSTYGGGTVLSGGVTIINSATSMGAISGATTFSGGTLQLANSLTGITRNYQVAGANNAIIDTNAFALGYAGAISSLAGGTGGLTKIGAGTMTLSGANTFTGATSVNMGVLEITTGGSTSGGATNVINGATLSITGGTLTASATSSVASSAMELSSGSAVFNAGFNANSGNPSSGDFVHVTGGTFSTTIFTIGRCTGNANLITNPTAGRTESGFYINGGAATITGAFSVGNNSGTNSTSSARIDSGSLTVGGVVTVQVNSPDRWSVLDVNGGTFTSTDAVTGVQIGSGLTGSDAFLVRSTAVATVERFLLTQPAASTETSLINVSGGSLYVGAGGIVGNNNAGTGILDIQLGTATLGAKATWSTLLGATLNGTTVIKAADAADAAHDISIAGVLAGTGALEKTGGGTLTLSGTNTYTGTTVVSTGNLAVTGDSSAATGAVTVASGATLSGNGKLGGNVAIASGAHHALAVAATPVTQVPRLITGSLTLTAGNILDLTSAAPIADGVYVLATATGGIIGTPTTVTLTGGLTGIVSVSGNNLQLTAVSSAYASWATSKGLTGANNGATQDPESDGISNALEFVLGGNPLASDTSKLPVLTTDANSFIFTFSRADESESEIGLTFQYGSNLTGWTDVAVGAATAGQVAVTENGTSPDTVVVTIPKTSAVSGKLFGRLKAVK